MLFFSLIEQPCLFLLIALTCNSTLVQPHIITLYIPACLLCGGLSRVFVAITMVCEISIHTTTQHKMLIEKNDFLSSVCESCAPGPPPASRCL